MTTKERLAALASPRFLRPEDCTAVARKLIELMGTPAVAPPDMEQRIAASVELTIRAMVDLGWKVEPPHL